MQMRLLSALLVGSILLATGALWYKIHTYQSVQTQKKRMEKELEEISETIALKDLWKNTQTKTELTRLHHIKSNTDWQEKGKKIVAKYNGITIKTIDQILTRLMRTPVIINRIEIRQKAKSYDMEIECKSL